MSGFVYLVGAGPGDPGLITVRAVEALVRAEVIVADRLVADEIIARYAPPAAELITRPARRDGLDQEEINALLVERARRGQMVVRLKGGDPFVFGRGGEEAEALVDAGIPFVVVPGVTAAVAAPAYAGIPLTHRGLAGAVAFATGHETDDKEGGAIAWTELSRSAATLVLYMSVSRLGAVMARLEAAGRAATEPVAVVERGTTTRQRVVTGTIADIAERVRAADVQPPALTIVGEVVRLRERIGWFERRRRVLLLSTQNAYGVPDDVDVAHVPPLQIVPRHAEVRTALGRLERARTVVFVSTHAVAIFRAALVSVDRDMRALFGIKVAVVGAATANQLGAHGITADFVGRGSGAELAAKLIAEGAEGPAMILGAHDGRTELADALVAAGWSVDSVAAYDSIPHDAALGDALKAHRVRPFDAIAFTSPKGARAWLDVAGKESLAGVRIGAIGATTREALVAAGIAVDAVPPKPDVSALIDALAKIE
ncbi:MAG TPA: uroporphyrinogen-III C-methyltransferase [Polyangia bacterium]